MAGETPRSPKQEKFLFALTLGSTPLDAYHAAGYQTAGMSEEGVRKKAETLLAQPKLQEKLAELNDTLSETACWSKRRAISELLWLQDVAKREIKNGGISTASVNSFLNTVKELNRLENVDAPEAGEGEVCGVVVLPEVLPPDDVP